MAHSQTGSNQQAQEPKSTPPGNRDLAQASKWGEIGITAVAAAARYAGEAKPAAEKNKVVTLRDIDYLAA